MVKKWLTVERVFLLASIIVVIVLLFGRTFVGVADNGDFLRIMGSIGLNYYDANETYEDRFFRFAHANFAYDEFFRGFYLTSQLILVVLARGIAKLFNGEAFDIRVLGAIYAILLITSSYLLIRFNKTKSVVTWIALAALILFVFFDIAYLAYFNSLYGEPASLVFLLLTLAFGLMLTRQTEPKRAVLVLFFVSALLLVCSKTQNAPVGVGFALLGLRYATLKREKAWRRLGLSLSALTLIVSAAMYIAAPKDFKNINMYQTVFFGVLKDSPDVEGDLKELGLPAHLSVLAGTNYFQADTAIKQNDPSLTADFYDRISHADVLWFYVKNPGRLIHNMEYAAENGMMIRPYYLGNYEKSEDKSPGALSFQYSGWSEFKKGVLPNGLWSITLVFVVYFAAAAWEWLRCADRKRRAGVELLILLGLTGVFSFLIPIVGDGQADMGKHLFLFNAIFDMMLVTGAVWIVYRICSRIGRREQYKLH